MVAEPAHIPESLWSSPGHRSKNRYPLIKRWLTFERRTYVSNAHVLLWARRMPYLDKPPWDRVNMRRRGMRVGIARVLTLPRPRTIVIPGALWLAKRPLPRARSVAVRDLGEASFQARYIEAVADLYLGCSWYVGTNPYDPARAVLGGIVVAAVMPFRTNL